MFFRSTNIKQNVNMYSSQGWERICTHTLGFHVFWGLSMDIMIFLLYKRYITFYDHLVWFISCFLMGTKNVPKSYKINGITIFVGIFVRYILGLPRQHTHTPSQNKSTCWLKIVSECLFSYLNYGNSWGCVLWMSKL